MANGNTSFTNCLIFCSFSATGSSSDPEPILISNVYPTPYRFFRCCVEPMHLSTQVRLQLLHSRTSQEDIIAKIENSLQFPIDHDTHTRTQSIGLLHSVSGQYSTSASLFREIQNVSSHRKQILDLHFKN